MEEMRWFRFSKFGRQKIGRVVSRGRPTSTHKPHRITTYITTVNYARYQLTISWKASAVCSSNVYGLMDIALDSRRHQGREYLLS
jgi:hypothetical protein